MAMTLNVQLFSGAGTQTAYNQALAISNKYADLVNQVKSAWGKVDNWGATYASGGTFKEKMDKTSEYIQNIPEPSGNNANAYFRDLTDTIIRNANAEDMQNNKGQAQVSNPFQEQHYTCPVNTPATRAYKNIEDYTGFTDEGVADISAIKRYIDELNSAVGAILSEIGAANTTGTNVTGRDLTAEFSGNVSTNKATLTDSIAELSNAVDATIQAQEEAGKSVASGF